MRMLCQNSENQKFNSTDLNFWFSEFWHSINSIQRIWQPASSEVFCTVNLNQYFTNKRQRPGDGIWSLWKSEKRNASFPEHSPGNTLWPTNRPCWRTLRDAEALLVCNWWELFMFVKKGIGSLESTTTRIAGGVVFLPTAKKTETR